MEQNIQKTEQNNEIISKIVMKGDISQLNDQQKLQYYNSMCERLGLDPLTQPFQLLNLQGKHVLYCTKGGAEQLNKLYKISHEIRKRESVDGIYLVEVRASQEDRFVDEVGAVNVKNLSGDALVNGMLKAVTKAKRRATLSIMGLGMLDETEADTIPNAKKEPFSYQPSSPVAHTEPPRSKPPIDVPAKPVLQQGTLCADCTEPITNPKVLDYSKNIFGVPLCYDCQGARKTAKETTPPDELEADIP